MTFVLQFVSALFLVLLGETTEGRREHLDAYLTQAYARGTLRGSALVVRDGEVVYRGAGGLAADELANTPETRFRIGSLTKIVTQVAVLRLADRGELDLDAPIARYRPSAPHAEAITVRQLLNFTSGLPRELTGDSATSGVAFDERGHAAPFLDALELELDFPPGQRQAYSNVGYWIVGALLETVTGSTYEEALRALVFAPLKLTNTSVDSTLDGTRDGRRLRARGHEQAGDEGLRPVAPYSVRERYASGSLVSTVDDLNAFFQALGDGDFLSAHARRELFGRFRGALDESAPVLEGGGFVPGFTSYVVYRPARGELVLLLNNRSFASPAELQRIGASCLRVLEGAAPIEASAAQGGLEVRSIDEGLPDTELARAARSFVQAVRSQDEAAFVDWHATYMPEVGEAQVRAQARKLFLLPEDLGGFEIAVFQASSPTKLLLGVRGTAAFDVLLTFTGEGDPLRIDALDIGRARR